MRHTKDLTGLRFGKLTVVRRTPKPEIYKNGSIYWLCKCDCGSLREVRGGALTRTKGSMTTCKKCWYLPDGTVSHNQLFLLYKHQAKRRNMLFELAYEDFKTLVSGNCFYCGSEPKQIHRPNTYRELKYNGIDRVDNNKGYIKDNCVPCCKTCNSAKLCMSQQEFFNWIKRVYEKMLSM